ncbi:TPA: hypothetical protein DEF17_02185 [bacterium]|nr:MAG: hypothetical protein AUJ18_06950 [Candidatus Hydrogenedentes bacterium CG1_02_42_14]PIU48353.1 MAG: hypothetical protein COS94_02660 [Candidatus Hydrogenedentes bacterium CG07_land_8_20_14_0_80_42_17]HBW46726.1 hypothetical protein [bacterium]
MSVDLEKLLRPVDTPLPPYPPKVITLADGSKMVVRQIGRDDIPDLLPHVEALIHHERDYYDIVSVRVYAELLAYYRYRVVDEYVLIGQINGELSAIVNGRIYSPEIGMSYHTLGLKRGLRIGAHCFAAKMEYHIDVLKQEEVLIVAESPIGFRRWMIEYNLEKKFEIPHELGGSPSYSLTREIFNRARGSLIVGSRPVPQDLLDEAMEKILPPSDPPKAPPDFLAATRAKYDSTGTSIIADPKRKKVSHA